MALCRSERRHKVKTRIMPHKPFGTDCTYWRVEIYRRLIFGIHKWVRVGEFFNYTDAKSIAEKCMEINEKGEE